MSSLICSASWSFGLVELIYLVSAFLTLVAILTSLYLATKSKTLKFKIMRGKPIKIF